MLYQEPFSGKLPKRLTKLRYFDFQASVASTGYSTPLLQAEAEKLFRLFPRLAALGL